MWRPENEADSMRTRARCALQTVHIVGLALRDTLFQLYVGLGIYDAAASVDDVGVDGPTSIDVDLCGKISARLIVYAITLAATSNAVDTDAEVSVLICSC